MVVFGVFSVVLSTCLPWNAKSEQATEAEKTSKPSDVPPKQTAAVQRFKTFSYVDQQGIGIEAFRMLIPSDWEFDGGIRWVLDNPGMPAVASFRVRNPKGTEEFEVFPNQPFFWTDNQMLLFTFPIGSRYFGNEVHPPLNPIEALKQIVVPRFRSNVADVRIINEQSLPGLAAALGAGAQAQPGVSVSAEGAKIRIEYNRNGVPLEEEIYAVVESFAFGIQTMAGTVTNMNWMVDYIFSFKVGKGGFDAASKIFQVIVHSFKLNPQWFSKYSQVVEYLIQGQIQQIQNLGQLSRIISQTSNEISDMNMQSYYQRQAVNDRIADNFSQYIRGVDKYYNPIEQKPVELPSGYENAWSNALGEYILSNDPSFNPNIGSTVDWQIMKRNQ
jgi:hypothetical protein